MVNVTWSHSGLKAYEQCPRQYHEVTVLKSFPKSDTVATLYGKELHTAAEKYIRDNEALPKQFEFMQPMLDALVAKPGRKLCEHEMALTKDLKPCDFHDPNRWVRGIADLIILNDENLTAKVIDYKSGNNKYPDREQLKLMALMIFAHYPHIRKVSGALLFVVKNDMVRQDLTIDRAESEWWSYRQRVARIEQAHETGVWNPKPTPLCGWCPVVKCLHNPKH